MLNLDVRGLPVSPAISSNIISCSYFPKDPSKLNDEQTIIAMRDAQVFMALISDAYVNDKHACDLLTYAYMTLKKPLILVVLGGGQDWRKSRVGILLSDEVH